MTNSSPTPSLSGIVTPQLPVVDLIRQDYNILPILSRFSIPLGFGSKTIADVCRENDIDLDTFILIVNFILSGQLVRPAPTLKATLGIVDFLHNSHDYFLGYKFPHIRANLLQALDQSHSDINPSIVKFFDDYVEQVKIHFAYEEATVFPYIRSLERPDHNHTDYNIHIFQRHHEEIDSRLSDLKNIILRYYTTSMPNKMYDVLVDIFSCEADLLSHTEIENHLLIPMVDHLEHDPHA
ncbi:MAG: hemerythrin domain-containing protein [Bacteroidales bacterium]|nr:hemerythrin domain-containing protein [Bacteroidales bacterium]